MNTKPLVEVRMDDVLQASMFAMYQKRALEFKTMYEWFREADEMLEKHNYPCILAICAGGIDKELEWVEYIRCNQHRYKIELHGLYHNNYAGMGRIVGKAELSVALDKIEETFGVRPTTWYLPWGRKGAPTWGPEVCKELGIKYDLPTRKLDSKFWLKEFLLKGEKSPFDHVNFHYWRPEQIKSTEEVIKIIKNI